MSDFADPDDYDDEAPVTCDQCGWELEYEDCQRCDGDGEVVVCCDDLCANSGRCIHGDGYGRCPDCGGTGSIWFCPNEGMHDATTTKQGGES